MIAAIAFAVLIGGFVLSQSASQSPGQVAANAFHSAARSNLPAKNLCTLARDAQLEFAREGADKDERAWRQIAETECLKAEICASMEYPTDNC